MAIVVPIYQHAYGNDYQQPPAGLILYYPALATHSYLATLGSTFTLGGGFDGFGSENAWGDLSNNGAQSAFRFGRLTVTESGTFSVNFAVAAFSTPVVRPFSFELEGSGS